MNARKLFLRASAALGLAFLGTASGRLARDLKFEI